MQFPESWLRSFCNPALTTQQLADTLTIDSAGEGLAVEGPYAAGVPLDDRNLVARALAAASRRAAGGARPGADPAQQVLDRARLRGHADGLVHCRRGHAPGSQPRPPARDHIARQSTDEGQHDEEHQVLEHSGLSAVRTAD